MPPAAPPPAPEVDPIEVPESAVPLAPEPAAPDPELPQAERAITEANTTPANPARRALAIRISISLRECVHRDWLHTFSVLHLSCIRFGKPREGKYVGVNAEIAAHHRRPKGCSADGFR